MKVAVAGNQWITEFLIDHLHKFGIVPKLIINMDNVWEDRISGYKDLSETAENIGAALFRPEKYNLKSSSDEAALAKHDIDILLVFGWQRLIPEWLIKQCKKGVWGVHGGPEKPPRCRGRAVFNWSLIMGYNKFYMYLFKITPEVDEGDIIDLREFQIRPSDDILTLYHKNCIVSTSMFLDNVASIYSESYKAVPQSDEGATYLPKRDPEDGGIDWSMSTEQLANLIRAVAPPYPGAFTKFEGVQVSIKVGHIFDEKIEYEGAVGSVLEVFPNGDFLVRTGDGALYVREWESAQPLSIKAGNVFDLRVGRQPPLPEV